MFLVPARRLTPAPIPFRIGQVAIAAQRGRDYQTTGGRLPSGWLVPVILTVVSPDQRGPFYLRIHSSGDPAVNNESRDRATTPWITVYNDPVPVGDTAPVTLAQPGSAVMSFPSPSTASASHPPVGQPPHLATTTMVAYVVFGHRPAPGSVSHELNAAPDGVHDYTVSTGLWNWDTEPIYLATNGASPNASVIRPAQAWLSSSSGFSIEKMTWQQWDSTRAVGTGEADVNLCEPVCAEGKHVSYPVTVVLSDPKKMCGKQFYTKLHMTASGDIPNTMPDDGSADLDITPFC